MIKKIFSMMTVTALLWPPVPWNLQHATGAPEPDTCPTGPAYQAGGQEGRALGPDLQWRQFFRCQKLRQIIEMALVEQSRFTGGNLNVEQAWAMYRFQRATFAQGQAERVRL
jgi:hypothetical protein